MKFIIFFSLVWTVICFIWNYPVKGIFDKLRNDIEVDQKKLLKVALYLPHWYVPFIISLIALVVYYL